MRPKAVDDSPLPWRPKTETKAEEFEYFCRRFLKVGKGGQKLKPLILRPWQQEVYGDILNSSTRLACLLIGRGNGKSSILGAIAVWELFTYGESAQIVVCASDQRQAGIIFNAARRYIELAPELASRCQISKERIFVPRTNSSIDCLPADPKSLEGLDYSTCLLDECGVVSRETYEVLQLAQAKRESSRLIACGTPPANPTDSVLTDLRTLHRDLGDDAVVFREFSADEFQHHDVNCVHCAELANPALGDFLSMDALKLSKTTRESTYRRQRLCQFVRDNENPFLTPDVWDRLNTGQGIPEGAEVVLAVDGAFGGANSDACALIVGAVSSTPHFQPIRVWSNPHGDPDYRVPLLDVEQEIREAHKRWSVREVVADPYRLGRTLEVLAGEGFTVSEFPWSPARVTRACGDVHSAAHNGNFTHSGDETLRDHVLNARLVETNQGILIDKTSRRKSAGKIDLLAALIMCHSRCVWLGTKPKKRYRTASFA